MSDPLKSKLFENYVLPNEIRVAGFDLGIGTPLTVSSALITKDSKIGNVYALDYGHGNIIESKILAYDTSLSNRIKILSGKTEKLKEAIREYKISKKNNVKLEPEISKWLEKESRKSNVRNQIQIILSEISKQENKLKQECIDNGHNNLSESIRLLELMKKMRSLKNSYDNIHVLDNKKHIHCFKFDDKMENFRKFVSEQYASLIVKYCKSNTINVAFIEDLEIEMDFDKNNKENSLTILFASGQLKKCIEEGLHKAGIGCVFTPPNGTSRKDPVSGNIGYRDKYDKTKLYVVRDGKLGYLHADLVGSMNVLLSGLSHSIVPYKIFAKSKFEDKKRLTRFLKASKMKLPQEKGWFYYNNGEWINENDKKNEEARIKDLSMSGIEIEQFNLSPCRNNAYKSFQVWEVLE